MQLVSEVYFQLQDIGRRHRFLTSKSDLALMAPYVFDLTLHAIAVNFATAFDIVISPIAWRPPFG